MDANGEPDGWASVAQSHDEVLCATYLDWLKEAGLDSQLDQAAMDRIDEHWAGNEAHAL